MDLSFCQAMEILVDKPAFRIIVIIKEVPMKKMALLVLAVAVLVSVSNLAYAKTPSDKLSRGIANVLGGELLEVPKNIDLEWKGSKNAAVGIFCGLFKGVAMAVARLGSGMWDVLTFPAAVPKDYEPFLKPDYVFDKS